MRADNRDRVAARRTRWAWYSYDFGNTAVEFAIPLYLTVWIVNDLGVSAVTFGLATAISSWAIGLSGPFIGVNADEKGRRRFWFMISVLVAGVLLASVSILPHTRSGEITAVLIIAMVANYFFQLSSLIYNASMLSAAGKGNVVSLSSRGMALSFAGGAVGIGLIELVISGRLIPGVSGRGYALIPAALVFLACAVPSMFTDRLWQKKPENDSVPSGTLLQRMTELWRESAREHKAGWFLGGYFALNSAITGLTLYLPLHIGAETGAEGLAMLGVFAPVGICSALGALIVARMKPDQTMVRRIILWGLTLLGVNALVFSYVNAVPAVILFASLHGLFSGALVPTVRGAFSLTFRADYQALAFGLFGAVQRVSQGLGAALAPLAGAAAGEGATSAGIAAMGVVALVGVPLFARWRLDPSAEGDLPVDQVA